MFIMLTEMVEQTPDNEVNTVFACTCLANNDQALPVVALYAGGADRNQFLYNDHSSSFLLRKILIPRVRQEHELDVI